MFDHSCTHSLAGPGPGSILGLGVALENETVPALHAPRSMHLTGHDFPFTTLTVFSRLSLIAVKSYSERVSFSRMTVSAGINAKELKFNTLKNNLISKFPGNTSS